MLKLIRRGNPEDCKKINVKAKYAEEKLPFAGTVEMFDTLWEIANPNVNRLMEVLEDLGRYDLIKHMIRYHRVSLHMFDNFLLDRCLPESIELLKYNLEADKEEFARTILENNHLQQKDVPLFMQINEEVYLEARKLFPQEMNYFRIEKVSSDCLKFLETEKYLQRTLKIFVKDIKDIESFNLDFGPLITLHFETTEVPDDNFLEKFQNIDMIINPYYLTKWELHNDQIHLKWSDADYTFLQESNCQNEFINSYLTEADNLLDRMKKIYRLIRFGFSNGIKEMITELNYDLQSEPADFAIWEKSPSLIWFINHEDFRFIFTFNNLWRYQDFSFMFRFANWDLIGEYLQFIPFTQREMKRLVRLNPNLYIYKKSCIKYKKPTQKSAFSSIYR